MQRQKADLKFTRIYTNYLVFQRFEGFPSVTAAPNSRNLDVAQSLVRLPPDMRTRAEELSDSVMNASALNDLQDTLSGIGIKYSNFVSG